MGQDALHLSRKDRAARRLSRPHSRPTTRQHRYVARMVTPRRHHDRRRTRKPTMWVIESLSERLLLLMGKGAIAEAKIHARNAVRIAPENPQAYNLMGMVMTEANRPQIGEYHYRRVLELAGQRDPVVLANLAWNLKSQGKVQGIAISLA